MITLTQFVVIALASWLPIWLLSRRAYQGRPECREFWEGKASQYNNELLEFKIMYSQSQSENNRMSNEIDELRDTMSTDYLTHELKRRGYTTTLEKKA